jgi:hypothetical protein
MVSHSRLDGRAGLPDFLRAPAEDIDNRGVKSIEPGSIEMCDKRFRVNPGIKEDFVGVRVSNCTENGLVVDKYPHLFSTVFRCKS